MLYDVGMRITYSYDRPAAGGRHLLRLLPADLPGQQRLVSGLLSVSPAPAERSEMVDFFGNYGTEIIFRDLHDEIEFRVDARVERFAEPSGLDISPPLSGLAAEIAEYRSLDPDSPLHFLWSSARVQPTPEMTDYARAHVFDGITAFSAVLAIGRALFRDMEFDAEATTVETLAKEAFARRRGVCQDFAQIMIAMLRGIGVPAGYVSGFLRTNPPPGQPRLEGADAMHAWVRAWCGRDMGWIEFDPTNDLVVSLDHIVIARGRDYGDVSPVRGILRIAGDQTSEQAVDVIPVGAGY
ncbi:transglutaminase family protein [Amaricoccus solimangrovi]|uniref:Transglutaminase family protein n=1 Tax=Amaricoccus solimangrovi TaxID=2589815 RepID=A0A501WWS1_9RHOB|nr:transglutaminase family protein [Amaricoccus solimangrovi]TPE53172.1 transglutaminase family protein [Amaricoccus solimangrovi]